MWHFAIRNNYVCIYLSTNVFIACTIMVKVHSYCHGESYKQSAKESACSYPIRHPSVSSTGEKDDDILEAHCYVMIPNEDADAQAVCERGDVALWTSANLISSCRSA